MISDALSANVPTLNVNRQSTAHVTIYNLPTGALTGCVDKTCPLDRDTVGQIILTLAPNGRNPCPAPRPHLDCAGRCQTWALWLWSSCCCCNRGIWNHLPALIGCLLGAPLVENILMFENITCTWPRTQQSFVINLWYRWHWSPFTATRQLFSVQGCDHGGMKASSFCYGKWKGWPILWHCVTAGCTCSKNW